MTNPKSNEAFMKLHEQASKNASRESNAVYVGEVNIPEEEPELEFMVFSAHEDYISERLNHLFSEGWKKAGEASVHYHGTPTNAAFIYIPLERKTKKS